MSLADQEKEILRFWGSIDAFKESIKRRPKSKRFVFFEGPPTANGLPGIHHAEARSFKDVILRYKTMRGFRVERRAGWDTHGLPVELEVEKQLGLKDKKAIEQYGIEKFNEACRKSVWTYKKNWEEFTDRMGYWLDMENPYVTSDPLYMETLWWILGEAHKKDLLYEGNKVVPYCPRCQTAVSYHEVAQGYAEVTDITAYVKFAARGATSTTQLAPKTYFLAWTTTPWTLPGNVALAVGKNITYLLVKQGDEHYILAKERVEILDGDYKIVREFRGKDLEGIEYEPVFDSLKDAKEKKHYVAIADFVTTQEGTGIVHIAVMYGEDDFNLGEKLGLPKVHTVAKNGTFNDRVPQWEGKFVKHAEEGIRNDLRARGLLYKQEKYKHAYPFCWRCKTHLLYYAGSAWFIAMSKLRDKLLENNNKVDWVPAHLKDGRMGQWLREVKDWTISRSRYWGTPLPVWRCDECDAIEVIGSRKELRKKTFSTNSYLLLRHGEATKNLDNIISSSYASGEKHPLTKKGIAEAKRAAKEIKKTGGVDIIVSSDILRTRQTAEIVAEELGASIVYDKDIREYDLSVLDGKKSHEYYDMFPTVQDRFLKKVQGIETLAHLQKRMVRAMARLEKKYRSKRILIISHGDPLWILESAAQGLTIEEAGVRRGKNYPEMGSVRPFVWRIFPYGKGGELDLHRPYVDRILFQCASCKGGTMKRVEEVMDVWFDSGAMPYAQVHYPFENKAAIDKNEAFPADYISEAVDQTRGWFYTLAAISSILEKGTPYKHVISLGHVLDKSGKKMSKSLGNIVDPGEIMETYSADALRWYFFTVNNPGDTKRFDEREIRERNNKYVRTLGSLLDFYRTYSTSKAKITSTNVLDRWILAKLEETKRMVQLAMDSYDITTASRALDYFVINDLSNWYVRRSRARFQKPGSAKEQGEAVGTLASVLVEVAYWSAPFTPFIAERIFQEITGDKKTSVHWGTLSSPRKESAKDLAILKSMEIVRSFVQEGLRLRSEVSIRVRQPLSALNIKNDKSEIRKNPDLLALVEDEVNVKEIIFDSHIKEEYTLNTVRTQALLREGLARELTRNIQGLRKASGLSPQHKISVRYSLPLGGELADWEETIARDTNAKTIEERHAARESFLGSATFSWQQGEVWVGIKKV